MADSTAAPNYNILINGKEIPDTDFQSFVVDRDMFQPDMATIVLSNQGNTYSTKAPGSTIEIQVGDKNTPVYKGEVIGLEPTYKGGEKMRIVLRCMNKLHRLLRGRKSKTFTHKTDRDILSEVVGNHGLSLDWKHEANVKHEHVYQHNQTDMEFLRVRAARVGCHVWCVDSKVFVHQPELQGSPIAKLSLNEPGGKADQPAIKSFTPRLSSASIVKKVTVRGWNPETKQLIVGEASAASSRLGSQNAVASSGALGDHETFTVDHPIWSVEEARMLAKARLSDLSLTYITGELELTGDPKLDLGKLIQIDVNGEANKADDPFNGTYYIMGLTQRFSVLKSKDGGFHSFLRLARDAQKSGS